MTQKDEQTNVGQDNPYLLLYIEDNQANISLMEDIIYECDGWSIAIATTAEEGLILAKDLKPTMILCDINLPGMSGIWAVKSLRQIPKYQGTYPIYALSADITPKTIDAGLAAGFSGYMTKPVRLKELEITLQVAAGKHK